MRIRLANPEDLPAAAAVWRESARSMDGGVASLPSEEELAARIDDELTRGWQLYLAIEDEGIAGLVAIIPARQVLDQLFVLPSRQGAGIGSALLMEAQRHMPAGFTLRMSAANHAAQRFYEKKGLRVLRDGVHPHTGLPVRYMEWLP